MAAPVVQSRASSQTGTASLNHSVAYPTGIASGDLLICIFNSHTGANFPVGWTVLAEIINFNDVMNIAYVATKVAEGTESGSFTVTTNASKKAVHFCYRISGAGTPTLTSGSHNATTNPDPPNHDPGAGSKDYVWLATSCRNNTSSHSAYPTNYTNGQNQLASGTGGVGASVAERTLTASSENPGTFTVGSLTYGVVLTLSIPPPDPVTQQLYGDVVGESNNVEGLISVERPLFAESTGSSSITVAELASGPLSVFGSTEGSSEVKGEIQITHELKGDIQSSSSVTKAGLTSTEAPLNGLIEGGSGVAGYLDTGDELPDTLTSILISGAG